MSSRMNTREKREMDSIKNSMVSIVAAMLAVLIFFESIFLAIRAHEYFGFISYDDLNNFGEVELSLSEGEYYYSIDEYINRTKNVAVHSIDDMNNAGLLIDSVYDYLIDGVDSEYFDNATLIYYEQYQKDADKFITACNKLSTSAYESNDSYACSDDCMFNSYLEQYIREDKRVDFEEAHKKYHAALERQRETLNLTEGELKYYYEAFLLSQLDNIEEIEVELTYLTARSLYLDDSTLNWYVRSDLARPFKRKKTLTIKDKEALAYLDLALDAGMFDSSIVPSVANMLYQIGDQLENRVNSNVTVVDITGIDDYEAYVERKKHEKTTGVNVRDSRCFFPISISERYEGEQIYIMYNVINCKHKEELPSYESFINSKQFSDVIQRRLEDDFWTELMNSENELIAPDNAETIDNSNLTAEEIADMLGAVG